MNEINSPYWTSREAAAYLRRDSKYGYKTVERWVREGKIVPEYVGRQPVFTKDILDRFVKHGGIR